MGQFISVKTKGSSLNIRQSPSTDSKIVGKLENNTIVGYSDEWEIGWIKINNFTSTGHFDGYHTEGWVSSKYLNAPNFKSKILEPIDLRDDIVATGRGMPVIENVDGVIFVEGWDDFVVKINGEYSFLKRKENYLDSDIFDEYYNDDLNIKIFNVISKEFFETNHYKGFMIINYKGIEEIIFTSMIL
tara:strand:- start:1757 stop:2317 length:561 start_codon:yes stop_codon:yes gene_type:complete